MKYNAKPNTALPEAFTAKHEAAVVSDISIQRLIDDGLQALYREVKNLMILSSKGKLDAANARDLRDHLKLLFELKDRESDSLRHLSDEQLEAMAKADGESDDI